MWKVLPAYYIDFIIYTLHYVHYVNTAEILWVHSTPILLDTIYNTATLMGFNGFKHCIDFTIYSVYYIRTAEI